MKIDTKQLREDLNLPDKEFEARYPGLKKAEIRNMTSEELDKVVGGAGKIPLGKSRDFYT